MQAIQLQNDSLVEIATFLVRRWSENENIIVEISDKTETKTHLKENKIILTPIEKRIGNDFQKYRQFRTSLWYEAMRIKYCKKILSNDHAFGFILNTMETQRIEKFGRKFGEAWMKKLFLIIPTCWYQGHNYTQFMEKQGL